MYHIMVSTQGLLTGTARPSGKLIYQHLPKSHEEVAKFFSGQVPVLEPSRGLYVPEAAAEVSFSKHRMAHARDPERGGQHGMAIQPYFVEGVAS